MKQEGVTRKNTFVVHEINWMVT